MRSAGRVSKREEKALPFSIRFVLIPLSKACEKSLLSPLVKKLPTGHLLLLDPLPAETRRDIIEVCDLLTDPLVQ